MPRPYIICHMMSSVDGRIDCGMTAQLAGNDVYYDSLAALDAPTRVSGRVTAQDEMASGVFDGDKTPIGHPCHSAVPANAAENGGAYEVIMDTHGTLLWNGAHSGDRHLLIAMSGQAPQAYADYLDSKGIAWIAAGTDSIDLAQVCSILATDFGVERMAVVGGAHINGGFLKAGLLDEISVVIGPGIDGREGMPGVFDGLAPNAPVTHLKLISCEPSSESGAIWLRYKTL